MYNSTHSTSITSETTSQESQSTKDHRHFPANIEDLKTMGHCLSCPRKQMDPKNQCETNVENVHTLSSDRRQTVDASSNAETVLNGGDRAERENEDVEQPEHQSYTVTDERLIEIKRVRLHEIEHERQVRKERDLRAEECSKTLWPSGPEILLQTDATMSILRQDCNQDANQPRDEDCPRTGDRNDESQDPDLLNGNGLGNRREEETTAAVTTTESILAPDRAEEGGIQARESLDIFKLSEQRELLQGTDAHEYFQESPAQIERYTERLFGRGLQELLGAPKDCETISLIGRAKEIDTLYPNKLDTPPVRLSTHFGTIDLQIVFLAAIRNLHVLRLPRLQPGNGIKLEEFFALIAQNSSSLRELVFEDDGAISTGAANILFRKNCMEKIEVYGPGAPTLRGLIIGDCVPKEICFHATHVSVERDLCMFLQQKGSCLKSLHLGFNLSIQDEPTTGIQMCFWRRMIYFLDYELPTALSQLTNLELSSSPSFKVKHYFNSIGSEPCYRTTSTALTSIQQIMNAKCRIRHPKETEISLSEIKVTGGVGQVVDCLNSLSWVNQGRMGVQVEIPGALAVFQRGYGEITPVVLQSLQLDQFIFEMEHSNWIEVTALKEVDIGDVSFVQRYSTGDGSIRETTRKLLVTSRESLSRVRAYYEMPSREIVMHTAKLLGEVVALAPFVSRLDVSRDIVLYAAVRDKEYVDTLMMLRAWDLKTLQLLSARNYKSSKDSIVSVEGCSATGFTKFLSSLPAFLTVLAMACPRLESLVLEWDKMDAGADKMTTRKLIKSVRKALDVYESNVPTVNAESVRGLVHEWYEKSQERV